MDDAHYIFMTESKEKKRTASGAFHKRTHCGKSGAIKFPSDYLTKKELKAMNGEVVSYRINDPMTWNEFRSMPEDIQVMYITQLRNKFGVPDSALSVMLECSRTTAVKQFQKLGISKGKEGPRPKFDKYAWVAWLNGCSAEQNSVVEEKPEATILDSVVEDLVEGVSEEIPRRCGQDFVMTSGNMSFDGNALAILEQIGTILGDSRVHIQVIWNLAGPEEVE